ADKDIKDYYDRNLKTVFTHRDQVHARHILIEVSSGANETVKAEAKAKAQKVLSEATAGGDFDKLAKQYSEDEGNRFRGGDLGWFERGRMVKPFEDAAFAMKP